MLVALAAGAWLYIRQKDEEEARINEVRLAVTRLSREVRLRAAMGDAAVNGRGWPRTIDPDWFAGSVPRHNLLTGDRPWIEVAPPDQADLANPPIRVAVTKDLAAFWYNPGNGIVRARAPMTLSDKRATELYNEINGTTLASIFEDIVPRDRLLTRPEPEMKADAGGAGEDAHASVPTDEPRDLDPTKPPE